jgi:hypothetical protein
VAPSIHLYLVMSWQGVVIACQIAAKEMINVHPQINLFGVTA